MGILIAGKSIQHKLTAAEGLTSRMIHEIVRKDPALIGNAGSEPAEGTLLPETYFFTRGMTRGEILARMAKAQRRLLATTWAQHAPGFGDLERPARGRSRPRQGERLRLEGAESEAKDVRVPVQGPADRLRLRNRDRDSLQDAEVFF